MDEAEIRPEGARLPSLVHPWPAAAGSVRPALHLDPPLRRRPAGDRRRLRPRPPTGLDRGDEHLPRRVCGHAGRGRACRPGARPRWLAQGQAARGPEQHHARLVAALFAAAQPGRAALAVLARAAPEPSPARHLRSMPSTAPGMRSPPSASAASPAIPTSNRSRSRRIGITTFSRPQRCPGSRRRSRSRSPRPALLVDTPLEPHHSPRRVMRFRTATCRKNSCLGWAGLPTRAAPALTSDITPACAPILAPCPMRICPAIATCPPT